MAGYRFYQLDVFTSRPLRGNPLAVFPDARGLTDDTMQRLAREMNLSETTFVLPSDTATRRVRFFTPTAEVPLVGHPTIGTWWALTALGLLDGLPADGTVRVTQETGRGVLPVDLELRDGAPARVVMTQTRPEFMRTVTDAGALARALGTTPEALDDTVPAEVVSTAMPQLVVPLRSVAALAALPSGGTGGDLATFLRAHGTDCVMCYVLTPEGARCRMFAPGLGVPEDPATGSAAGALGAHLARHRRLPFANGGIRLRVEQGREIARPSEIDVEVAVSADGTVGEVRVGGTAVQVIAGEVTL